jgi:hypothetical protein
VRVWVMANIWTNSRTLHMSKRPLEVGLYSLNRLHQTTVYPLLQVSNFISICQR